MLSERNCTDRQRAVFRIQKWLRMLKNAGHPLPDVVPDGIYGEETANAVRIFQGMRGLAQTGVVDRTCWDELKNLCRSVLEEQLCRPDGVLDFPMRGNALRRGDRGVQTAHLQALLAELQREGLPAQQNLGGEYDEGTEENVRYLQSVCGLPETGEADPRTIFEIGRLLKELRRSE